MTQQYLAGELSLLLAQLRAATTDETHACGAAQLRREAETTPLPGLPAVVTRAVLLADAMCWDSIARGDLSAFSRQAEAGAALYEFGLCAGLLRGSGRMSG